MDPPLPARPRKRRAINACISCRTSKVRCDGNRPCQRCDRNSTTCQYHDAVKDENVLRIEKLEEEMTMIREHMRVQQGRDKSVSRHLQISQAGLHLSQLEAQQTSAPLHGPS